MFAATAGLVDRSTMRHRSRIRMVATRHMLLQFTAVGLFIGNLAIRWSHRYASHSSLGWIVLDAIAVLTTVVAADLGGQMVFKMGFRVGPGGE